MQFYNPIIKVIFIEIYLLKYLIENIFFVQLLRSKPWTYKSKFCFSVWFFCFSFFHSVSNFLDCTLYSVLYSLWWEPWPRENCTVCTVHVYTLLTRTVPTTHLEIKLAWVLALQSWAYNNQGKYRIIGTSIDFVNLRLIMNRVGILARASTSNEIFQTKILAWVSTLQSSTQHKNEIR